MLSTFIVTGTVSRFFLFWTTIVNRYSTAEICLLNCLTLNPRSTYSNCRLSSINIDYNICANVPSLPHLISQRQWWLLKYLRNIYNNIPVSSSIALCFYTFFALPIIHRISILVSLLSYNIYYNIWSRVEMTWNRVHVYTTIYVAYIIYYKYDARLAWLKS